MNIDTGLHPTLQSLLPIIYTDVAEILLKRQNYHAHLQNLAQHYQDTSLAERKTAAEAIGAMQPFFIANQGLNDRDLQKTYGKMICQLMADRYPQWSRPIFLPPSEIKGKIRIGFVSGFFYDHSVWKIPLKGWIQNLNRTQFELFGYYTDTRQDWETGIAERLFDRFTQGPLSLEQWCETIMQDRLHVLIFPEFGMNAVTVQLGCLRLAPIGITTWGHPDTSGMPTIDYYLSSDLMESEKAQEHYTEKLVRLPNLSVCYTSLPIQAERIEKLELGLKENDILFWCCQSLDKYLPQYDDVFPKIAKALSNCKFAFIESVSGQFVTEQFRQRLERAFAQFGLQARDYCIFLPRLNAKKFAGVTVIADVVLDSIGWSGCNSTLESIALDIPVVTLPGELMRGRHTMAILKSIGLEETIATTKEDYVKIAVRLGREPDYRQQISRLIAENKHQLYGDLQPVLALEKFLVETVGQKAIQFAIQQHRANRLTQAEQAYQKILDKWPDHLEALYGLGLLANQRGETDIAKQRFNDILKAQPKSLKAWLSLGNLYQGQGQLTKAIAAYQQANTLQPDSVAVLNNLGYAFQQQRKLDEAIAHYRRALQIQPNLVEAEVNLANCLQAQGQLTPERQAHYANLNLKQGMAQQEQGHLAVAADCYRHAIALQPSSAQAHYHLGLILEKQKNPEGAINCYRTALTAEPHYGEAHLHLGKLYQKQNQLSEAAAAFRNGLKCLNPYYAAGVENVQSATTSEDISLPSLQGVVKIGGQDFPAIPPVLEGERPFWSVVIPVYNRTQYLLECLTSVLAQWTGTADMEILVIDDGSDLPLFDLVKSIGPGIVRYYRNLQNSGQQITWNTGIALSQGQWIHLLHDDDYVLPGFYTQLRQSLEQCSDSLGAAFTGYENINEAEQVSFTQKVYGEHRGIARDWLSLLGVANPLNPPAVVVRRSAYERLGGYHPELKFTLDWELCKRIATFYEALYGFRGSDNWMTDKGV